MPHNKELGLLSSRCQGASGQVACSDWSLPRVTIKMKVKGGTTPLLPFPMEKELAAKVVLLLKSFAGMMSEAQRESRITFGCGAKRHCIPVVVVRADQMMLL